MTYEYAALQGLHGTTVQPKHNSDSTATAVGLSGYRCSGTIGNRKVLLGRTFSLTLLYTSDCGY